MNYLKYPHEYCPYCYQKMNVPTEYYCRRCGKITSNQKPTYNVDYRGLPMCDCGGGPMFIRCANDKCRSAENIIPPTQTAVVVIAGMRNSGKSTYLLDLVNSQSSQTGVIISPKSHALIRWREKGIKDMKSLIALENTQENRDNFSSVVGMQVINKSEEICLSLTDRPGEETQDMDKMLGLNYLVCADYVILLLDLLNIKGIEGELTAKGIEFTNEAEKTSNITAIDSIIAVMETKRGKYGKKVPLFIGISKWDYIEKADLCPPGFSIGCNGADLSAILDSKRRFDKKKWQSNSKTIRNFLMTHESEVVNKAENFFKNVNYFAFSNYGTPPQIVGGIPTPPIHSPRHLMDPFYYILHDKKML